MIAALIDNGSLEPAAHRNLRAVASALSQQTGIPVQAVSWKHSDRVPADALDSVPAWTLARFVRTHTAQGERDFVFVPFFISAQGAIGSALRADLGRLQQELGKFEVTFTEGLAARGALAPILVDRVRTVVVQLKLVTASIIVVDHGGPSPASATLRNEVTSEVREHLKGVATHVAAASMEGADPHNQPLFADLLTTPPYNRGDVIVAPLFLSPGRHAGPFGDLARIAENATSASRSEAHYHFADLVGTHSRAVETLTSALRDTLSAVHVQPFA